MVFPVRFLTAADRFSAAADRFWEADHCAAAVRISVLHDAAADYTSVLRGAESAEEAVAGGVPHAGRAANKRAECRVRPSDCSFYSEWVWSVRFGCFRCPRLPV